MKTFRSWILLALFAASGHADALKNQLSVFFDMEPQDSVVALEQKSATVLSITVADPATGRTRVLTEEVGARPMNRLLTESNDLGLKTIHLSPPEGDADEGAGGNASPAFRAPTAAAATPMAGPAQAAAREGNRDGRSLSSERKNRMWYIGAQTALTTYVYGVAIPLAFDVKSARVIIATPMIAAPFAFGAHFWFAKNRPFEDAHLKGTNYLSLASLYASHALPFSIMDWDGEPYRTASILTLAAYPLGIWAGYELGDRYVNQPGRIDTQNKFALGLGALGFFSPFLYFEDLKGKGETVVRLGLGQSVAMAVGGHFLAGYYRSGENIPDGVNTGILNHTALGVGLGLEIAALADARSMRPWMGAALLGGTVGFMEGLYYYRDSYDSKERGLYNTLGGLAGTLMGGGVGLLASDDDASPYAKKALWTSLLVGGTWIGYWATDFLTRGMEDRTGKAGASWADRLAFNPLPLPEPTMRDREVYLRYRMPGLSYRF